MRSIIGGKRLAMAPSSSLDDWYVGYSPRNSITTDNMNGASVEGDWDDWVTLAKGILEADEKRKKDFETALATTNEQHGGALKRLADS